MAIAQRYAGVRRGYKTKTITAARREPTPLQRVVTSLIGGARELRAFVADELVYETIDTLRVLQYVRYELGFRPQSRSKPTTPEAERFELQPDRRPDRNACGGEPVRVVAER